MPDEMKHADARLARALASHLDPEQGSAFWIERERELGIDLRAEITSVEELPRLGAFDVAALRERPLLDFVPRRMHGLLPELILAETGGTTGPPLRCVFTREEFDEGFGAPFAAVSEARGFPRGGHWLFVGPSGPHVIGQAARLLARRHGALEPFAIDLDPRWARAQAPGSLGERLYREHLLDQALDIFHREPIEVLFTTPPLARALAEELAAEARERVRGIHLGGLPLSVAEYCALEEVFPRAVILPGYGNSLFGILVEPRAPRRGSEERHLDYFPLPGRLHLSIVEAEGESVELGRPVAPGERGRVVLSRLDESFLILNLVERDRATRIEGDEETTELGLAPRGLRDPHPFVREEAGRGLY
jgi:thienamycin biosynthesis protein ThnN